MRNGFFSADTTTLSGSAEAQLERISVKARIQAVSFFIHNKRAKIKIMGIRENTVCVYMLHSALRSSIKSSISSALINQTNLPYLVMVIRVSPSVIWSISRTSFGMTICHFVPTVTDPCIFTPASIGWDSFFFQNIIRKVRKVIHFLF